MELRREEVVACFCSDTPGTSGTSGTWVVGDGEDNGVLVDSVLVWAAAGGGTVVAGYARAVTVAVAAEAAAEAVVEGVVVE